MGVEGAGEADAVAASWCVPVDRSGLADGPTTCMSYCSDSAVNGGGANVGGGAIEAYRLGS